MKKPAENLGSVAINAGGAAGKQYGGSMVNGKFVPHSPGELRREVGPDGHIVEHRVRKSAYVHERLHSMCGPQKLADELYDAVWNVVGLGMTLEGWSQIRRANGHSMNPDKASGVLHGALESLAPHYGMIESRQVGRHRQRYGVWPWRPGGSGLHGYRSDGFAGD
jgi:hypothetical protein